MFIISLLRDFTVRTRAVWDEHKSLHLAKVPLQKGFSNINDTKLQCLLTPSWLSTKVVCLKLLAPCE